jgi:20S proteasome alpha/beta subunit
MTLCIAALCQSDDKRAAVLGFESRGETAIASTDYVWKLESIGHGWTALIAGLVSDAREAAGIFREFFDLRAQTMTDNNASDLLREPANRFRRALAEQVVQNRLALSYDEFLDAGAQGKIPDDTRRKIFYEIEATVPEIELLLVGPLAGRLALFRYSGGKIMREDNFAAVGTGAPIAESSLFQRGQHEHCNMTDTLYNVFEAQRLANIAPGVGKNKMFAVVTADSAIRFVTDSGEEYLAKQYQRLGPKDLDLEPLPGDALD